MARKTKRPALSGRTNMARKTKRPALQPEPEYDPDGGDIATEDDLHWYQYGKLYYTGDRSGLQAKMEKDKFFPNVFVISDHGNAHLITDFEPDLSSRGRNLVSTFGLTSAQADALDHNLDAAEGDPDKVDRVLDDANTLLNGNGIEPVTGNWHDDYYQDIVALYVNMGDTYDTTIYYDAVKGKFYVGAWGDFVEKYSDEYGIQ